METINTLTVCLLLLCHVTGNNVMDRAAAATTDPAIAHLTALADQLSHNVSQLVDQVKVLNSDLHNQSGLINALNSQNNAEGRAIYNVTSTLNQRHGFVDQVNALDAYSKNHADGLTKRITNLETSVAFSVQFLNDSVKANNTGHGYQFLKFDNVKYQTGGRNYNKTTGVFTAPSTGNYVFFLTLQRNDPRQNECVEAAITKKVPNHSHGYLAIASACPEGYTSASNMAVVYLRHGDMVQVETRQTDEVFGFIHTTFSGFKLTPH